MSIELSIVIPALNEREALPDLVAEVEAACRPLGMTWETIVIDDGSTDGSFSTLSDLAPEHPELGVIRLRRNFGKSAALVAGLERAAGELVVTLDGDGQDDPADIPAMIATLADADLVCGWKRKRRDPLPRRLASKLFNWATRKLTGLSLHDMNCGFKAFRGECVRSLELHGELHRYIPVLAAQQGWRVTELPVNHRPRRHGRSRFGSERYLRGALDLLAVVFVGRYEFRPLHLFGKLGGALALLGLAICAYLTALKISGEAIGERPLLFLGALLIVVGIQLLTTGLLAELLVVRARDDGASRLGRGSVERVAGFRAQLSGEPGSAPPARGASPRG